LKSNKLHIFGGKTSLSGNLFTLDSSLLALVQKMHLLSDYIHIKFIHKLKIKHHFKPLLLHRAF